MENSSIRRQWLDSYQSHLLEEEHSPQTIRKYIHDIAFFFSFLPAEAEISKEKVLAYKQELIQKYRPASANSMLVALNGFLSYIGLAQCRVRLFKLQRRSFRSPEKDLTRQEYERLVKAAKSHRNERLSLLLQTICSTGIRVSEHRFVTVEALQTGQVQISNKGKMRVIILPRELRGLLLQFCKKKEETNSCCCVGNCTPKTMAKTEASKSGVGVKVLGSGCVKCKTLENATREALVELGMDTTVGHVTDFSQIAAYGVMTTPALVVDGKVVSYGKVLTKKEAKTIIADARR